jgi:hypothetical protein
MHTRCFIGYEKFKGRFHLHWIFTTTMIVSNGNTVIFLSLAATPTISSSGTGDRANTLENEHSNTKVCFLLIRRPFPRIDPTGKTT